MGNNSVPKFIFRFSRFPVYRGSVLGRFYCTYIACLVLSFSPPRHMPEGYLQISNKGLWMFEAAALFLLRMLPSGIWDLVFWLINAVVQEQCPTPIFMESLYPEAGGCAFRKHICTYQIKIVNIIEDIHLQCKVPFRYVLLYHSMLHDRGVS